jgi:hypothetical protein
LPVSVKQDEARCIVCLEGEIGVSDAAELKRLLLEGLASGRKLHLDMERIDDIGELDVTFMQLLYATLRETGRSGAGLVMRLSREAEIALQAAGFGQFIESGGWTS